MIDFASLQMTLPSPYETLVWTIFVRAAMVASAPPYLTPTNCLGGNRGAAEPDVAKRLLHHESAR